MTEREEKITSNWEDDEEIIPDVKDPFWIEEFSKVQMAVGRSKTRSAADKTNQSDDRAN